MAKMRVRRHAMPVTGMLKAEYERGYKDGYAAAIETSATCHESVPSMRSAVPEQVERQSTLLEMPT